MSYKLFLVLTFAMLSTQADAQSFLKKLGKAVEETVKKEVTNALKGENNYAQPQQAPPATPTTPTSAPATSAPAAKEPDVKVVDSGQNITREPGLDYIDEYGINHGGGILIGGVLWAPVNCGYHETDYPYGKLYQWGRRHGQGYAEPFAMDESKVNPDPKNADIVPAPVTPAEARKHPNNFYARSDNALFNWTENDMKLWNNFTDDGIVFKNKDNDPCPEGWRVPELYDFHSLIEHHSKFVEHPESGQKGMWFSGPEPYGVDVARIFLPAAGIRFHDGRSAGREVYAKYWSLRHGGGEGMVWHLELSKNGADVLPMAYPHEAYTVRCVKDIEGQKMR